MHLDHSGLAITVLPRTQNEWDHWQEAGAPSHNPPLGSGSSDEEVFDEDLPDEIAAVFKKGLVIFLFLLFLYPIGITFFLRAMRFSFPLFAFLAFLGLSLDVVLVRICIHPNCVHISICVRPYCAWSNRLYGLRGVAPNLARASASTLSTRPT